MTGWIARISYSLYLTHKAVYHVVQLGLGEHFADHGVVLFATYATAALAVGALMHYLIEQPFLDWRERILAPARKRPPPASPDVIATLS